MTKKKSVYVCEECGFSAPKWSGKCSECGAWNSMVEEFIQDNKSVKGGVFNSNNVARNIQEIKSGEHQRYNTYIGELNRVLGGGIVKGSVTLISGPPGIGKSTLLLQVAGSIAEREGTVLYVSGEESDEQIKMRADRLGVNSENLYVLAETNLEAIEAQINSLNCVFVIVDSIQTLFNPNMSQAPGSVSQVRECSNGLMRIAKSKNIPFFIVAHVTKQGELAGPRVLEHMVDTVLSFEGERTEEFRILRTNKNRFGTTSEIGVFEMNSKGLNEILNPSSVFLEDINLKKEGSVTIGVMEGTRSILAEVQVLVSETKAPFPRRTAVGVDIQRLNLILAVLEKKLRIPFYNQDVYVNVVGGLDIDGTYGDLGIALALVSSIKCKETKLDKMLVVGEVGLTGEVRPVAFCDKIVKEGIKMGFNNIIIPMRNKDKMQNNQGIIGVNLLKDIMNIVF